MHYYECIFIFHNYKKMLKIIQEVRQTMDTKFSINIYCYVVKTTLKVITALSLLVMNLYQFLKIKKK